jgi:UDP-GlcNAc:undecaprenyl-phosphate GlcNAc-1-phosphate transferase
MKTYLCVYLSSAFLSLAITPAVIWLALRIKAVDRPGVRTVHTRPVPRIGGLAIFLSSISLIFAILFLNNSIGNAFLNIKPQVMTLLCSASAIFLIGLLDDLRGLPARFKFLAELLAAGSLCLVGVHISSLTVTSEWSLQFGFMSWPLTVLWIVGITNAVNLSDGLDGLAAGISAVACGVIAVFAIYGGNLVMAVLMLALLGSLSGFLFFNFNPAKIFMGDCGSLFVGFVIASASIMSATKSAALVGLALPFLALGIPIFDTLFSILRRFLERRPIFAPDRRHFHHRLVDLGLKQRHVIIIIYVITLLFVGLGMFMMVTRDISTLLIFFCLILLLLLLFRAVGSVRLRETISGLQRRYATASQYKQQNMDFQDMQLRFRSVRNFRDWWSAICETAERMDFAWLSLKTKEKDGSIRTEVWRAPDTQPDLSKVMIVTVPFNGSELSHEFEIAISINGSYESASHRATLFNRLIDEHRLQTIAIEYTEHTEKE